jgi:predicted enzyme related to lactoylglutathione lyase
MGQPVVHFEIMGRDMAALQTFYGGLFGWEIDTSNPMGYGLVDREANLSKEGVGIGGGIGQAPEGYAGHVTFYVAVPDVEAALQQAEGLGGKRMMGPEQVTGELVIGLFSDPEGRVVGLTNGG